LYILGIHGGVTINQHNAAAALICDGKLIAHCEEERFLRIKSARGFLPIHSIAACLKEAQIEMKNIDLVISPGETYDDMPARLSLYLEHYFNHCPPFRFINHQLAHLATAFYCSDFDEALCLSYDAYGDELSAAFGIGNRDGIEIVETRDWTNSLGDFYATMTQYLGFEQDSDEYKVMGLASYGKEGFDLSPIITPTVDGFKVNRDYWRSEPKPKSWLEPRYNHKLVELLGPVRKHGEPIEQRHKDIAYAAQKMLEDCAISFIKYAAEKTGMENLCLAGGIALNCSANYVISQQAFVEKMFVQPAASDRGLALGCALQGAADNGMMIRGLESVYMGPVYSEDEVRAAVIRSGLAYYEAEDVYRDAAAMLADGKIIGWYQGRAEFGPRALGNRSILADPRKSEMRDEVNNRIKFREEFRPFAPAVLEERYQELFKMNSPSPYMTVTYPVQEAWVDRLQAVTHVNGTARVQTVNQQKSPEFHQLISEFERLTGVPVLLNTSYNVRGEPIVETATDAIATFAKSGMHAMCIQSFVIEKARN
jgi:carbamoyltransferase